MPVTIHRSPEGTAPAPRKKSRAAAKELTAKMMKNKRLTTAELKRVKSVVHDAELVRSQEFVTLYRQHEHRTDEELASLIQQWLVRRESGQLGRTAGVTTEVTDIKRLLAYRMHRRGVTYDGIAQYMQCSIATIAIMVKEAREMLRLDPKAIDVQSEIGRTLDFYSDIQEMALSIASNSKNTPGQKVAGMQAAMQAERDRTDYMKTIGVFTPQLGNVLQMLVLASLKAKIGEGEHSMDRAVAELARSLMLPEAVEGMDNQQDLRTYDGYSVQSIAR